MVGTLTAPARGELCPPYDRGDQLAANLSLLRVHGPDDLTGPLVDRNDRDAAERVFRQLISELPQVTILRNDLLQSGRIKVRISLCDMLKGNFQDIALLLRHGLTRHQLEGCGNSEPKDDFE